MLIFHKKRLFLTGVVALTLCLGGIVFLSHCSKGKQPSSDLAPDFTLKTLDGEEITLSKLRGKVVLLDFWATWCGPCRESIPHFIQLYKTHQEDGFEMIGMSLDKGNAEVVRNFVKTMGIPYPIVMAPEEVVRHYSVTAIPVTFFIDREGKIRERITGFSSSIAQQMTAKVADLASEKP